MPLFAGLFRRLELDALTVDDAIGQFDVQWRGLRDRLCDPSGGNIRQHTHVRPARPAMAAALRGDPCSPRAIAPRMPRPRRTRAPCAHRAAASSVTGCSAAAVRRRIDANPKMTSGTRTTAMMSQGITLSHPIPRQVVGHFAHSGARREAHAGGTRPLTRTGAVDPFWDSRVGRLARVLVLGPRGADGAVDVAKSHSWPGWMRLDGAAPESNRPSVGLPHGQDLDVSSWRCPSRSRRGWRGLHAM